MARALVVGRVSIAAVLVLLSSLLLVPLSSARRASTRSVSGVVVDEVGAVARRRPRDGHATPAARSSQTTTSDAAGAFALQRSRARHLLGARRDEPALRPSTERVDRARSGSATPLRAVLKAGGFAESVVVTARRVETRIAETPQKIEVVDAHRHRAIGRGGPDRRAEEERRRRRRPVQRRAVRHRHPRLPAAVLRHQQALAAAHRRPAIRRHESGDAAARQRRAHRGAQGRRVGGLWIVGDGRRRQRDHAPVARQDRRQRRASAAAASAPSEFAGRVGGNVVVARRLRRHRQRLRSARRLSAWATATCGPRRATRPTTARCASASISRAAWRLDGRANGYRGRDIMTPGDLVHGLNSQGSKDLERSTAGRASDRPPRRA